MTQEGQSARKERCIFCGNPGEDSTVCNRCASNLNWFGFTWRGYLYGLVAKVLNLRRAILGDFA